MASRQTPRNGRGGRSASGPAQQDGAPAEAPPEVAGLGARAAAQRAVAELIGQNRALALEDALAQAARGLEPAEAALARAIATATFRRFGLIREALRGRLDQGLPEDQPLLLALLATGAAQILDLAVPDHAAVDLAVRLAKADRRTQHLGGLVNAVLRRVARERDAILAGGDPLGDGAPDWLAARWRAAYGPDRAEAIGRAHLAGATVDITVKADPEGWAGRLGAVSLPTGSLRLAAGSGPIGALDGFEAGAWWVQDAAAALPAKLLGARAGERIADLCAAPGGKTAQLAAAGAAVSAIDRSAPRLERLRRNLERLGLAAEVVVGDALALDRPGSFDAVLLDAPCSATGTIRRHPDVAWTKRPDDIARLAGLQARLLDHAATLLRPGGRLVYCTCSLEPEEGEAQIAAFLDRNADFARVPVGPDEVGGLAEIIDPNGDLRTLPCHLGGGTDARGGLDGFFVSRLTRRT
ncbi:RsmB/NOP family class I SAM-dependent RNA methyltransferase [Methylobacterium radiodurans]|uniref:RsmB/NOP family class I SAM-dependent RNA methyltransferase n=1 Tax=Methylobacterium radiodurans TaxID=2202828 RepID=UPI002483151C|nr:RsmB/NOP family class I SAM-dependent RNA methyltransferase [Methylobacterium radiodurans]